jgi:hypothetical protein
MVFRAVAWRPAMSAALEPHVVQCVLLRAIRVGWERGDGVGTGARKPLWSLCSGNSLRRRTFRVIDDAAPLKLAAPATRAVRLAPSASLMTRPH